MKGRRVEATLQTQGLGSYQWGTYTVHPFQQMLVPLGLAPKWVMGGFLFYLFYYLNLDLILFFVVEQRFWKKEKVKVEIIFGEKQTIMRQNSDGDDTTSAATA